MGVWWTLERPLQNGPISFPKQLLVDEVVQHDVIDQPCGMGGTNKKTPSRQDQ
jgi:hypothetical protein